VEIKQLGTKLHEKNNKKSLPFKKVRGSRLFLILKRGILKGFYLLSGGAGGRDSC